MASFSKDIKLKYGVNTYEETKKTYEWIEKSAKKWGGSKATISIEFQFHLGDIMCTAEGIQEFCEITYGVAGYHLISFGGNISVGDKRIFLNYLVGKFSVDTNNKVDLEHFLNVLETTNLEEEMPITYIEAQVNIETQNNGTIVQGDNNTVVSQSSNVNISSSPKESKLKKWFVAILQNILSNWIWYLLTAGIGTIITYYSLNG